jgi:hypothetical protein
MADPKWAEGLVPDDIKEDNLRTVVLRRQVRYWMFRIQNAETGGVKAEKVPKGFKEFFEKQKDFDSWENFGQTWDVEPKSPLVVRPRYMSIHEEWDIVIGQEVRSGEIAARQRQRKQAKANGSEGNL